MIATQLERFDRLHDYMVSEEDVGVDGTVLVDKAGGSLDVPTGWNKVTFESAVAGLYLVPVESPPGFSDLSVGDLTAWTNGKTGSFFACQPLDGLGSDHSVSLLGDGYTASDVGAEIGVSYNSSFDELSVNFSMYDGSGTPMVDVTLGPLAPPSPPSGLTDSIVSIGVRMDGSTVYLSIYPTLGTTALDTTSASIGGGTTNDWTTAPLMRNDGDTWPFDWTWMSTNNLSTWIEGSQYIRSLELSRRTGSG